MTANYLTRDFLIEAAKRFPDAFMWRNNRLSGWVIKPGKKKTWIDAGIDGQGDIRATVPVTVNGHKIGVSFEIEIKTGKDRQRLTQKTFAAAHGRAGGVYLIVRDVEQGLADLARAIAELESVA